MHWLYLECRKVKFSVTKGELKIIVETNSAVIIRSVGVYDA